jgi:hypothetical protein
MELWEIHPSLVHFPIALLIAALCADIYARARGNLKVYHGAMGVEPNLLSSRLSPHHLKKANEAPHASVAQLRRH